MKDLKSQTIPGLLQDKKPTSRYMGALVADAHNILLHGGIFGYPGTVKDPNGKIRLLYEANPLSLIIEEAGYACSVFFHPTHVCFRLISIQAFYFHKLLLNGGVSTIANFFPTNYYALTAVVLRRRVITEFSTFLFQASICERQFFLDQSNRCLLLRGMSDFTINPS